MIKWRVKLYHHHRRHHHKWRLFTTKRRRLVSVFEIIYEKMISFWNFVIFFSSLFPFFSLSSLEYNSHSNGNNQRNLETVAIYFEWISWLTTSSQCRLLRFFSLIIYPFIVLLLFLLLFYFSFHAIKSTSKKLSLQNTSNSALKKALFAQTPDIRRLMSRHWVALLNCIPSSHSLDTHNHSSSSFVSELRSVAPSRSFSHA